MRKKIFALFVLISILSLAAAVFSACDKKAEEGVEGDAVSIGGLFYLLNAAETEYSAVGVDDFNGKELSIRSSIDGIPVTKIAKKAFDKLNYITSLYIPSSVTDIGDNAFFDCKNLASVTFEEGSSLKSIGSNAFAWCVSLNDFSLPDGVESIGEGAFSNAEGLSHIGVSASSGLKELGVSAFSYCKNLASVYIPKGVAAISEKAFCGCDKLSEVLFDEDGKVESIGVSAFADCNGIVSIKIPYGVKTIEKKAFSNCFGIVFVDLPETLETIGDNAFEKCYKLVEVLNRSAITVNARSRRNGYVGYYALNIYGDEAESKLTFAGDGFVTYDGDEGVILLGSTIEKKDMTIPDGVSVIYKYAFYGSGVENLTLNDDLKSLGVRAFENCASLNLTEYDNARYVGSATNPYFLLYKAKSTSISNCLIHEDTVIINGYAFADCASLEKFNVPAKVISLGGHLISGNRRLTVISVSPENETFHSEGNCLIDTEKKTLIIGCKTSVIPSDGSVTAIGDYAFEGCYELSKIELPETLTSIGYLSFSTCRNLPSIRIPAAVTYIDVGAFYNCAGLVNVYFNDESGWCVKEFPEAEPISVNVSTSGSNVKRFEETYLEYIWEKN